MAHMYFLVPKYHPEPVLWTQLKPVSTNVMQDIMSTYWWHSQIIQLSHMLCSLQRKTFPCHMWNKYMWLELPIHMRRPWTLHIALNLPYYELITHDSVSRKNNILPLKCTKLHCIMLQQLSHASYTAPEITPSNVLNGNRSSLERDQLFSWNVHLTQFILFYICLIMISRWQLLIHYDIMSDTIWCLSTPCLFNSTGQMLNLHRARWKMPWQNMIIEIRVEEQQWLILRHFCTTRYEVPTATNIKTTFTAMWCNAVWWTGNNISEESIFMV